MTSRTIGKALHAPYSSGFGHIAVADDGTSVDRPALAWAVHEATVTGAMLTICGSFARSVNDLTLSVPAIAGLAVEDRIDEVAVSGDPVGALIELSHRRDLIVVSAEDAKDVSRRGDVSRIVAHSTCPVVVVRPERQHDTSPYPGHVVVGIDGTGAGRIAARFAFAYARAHRSPLAAVHADVNAEPLLWYDERVLETYVAPEPPLLQMVRDEIAGTADRYADVPVVRAVFGGPPAEALRYAATGARLLVVGRHGHRLPPEFRLGSVSAACVTKASGVLAVIPDGT